jgi:hypothetical protein
MSPLGAIPAACGGSLVYAAGLLGFGYVTWEEWAPLRAPIVGVARRMLPAIR